MKQLRLVAVALCALCAFSAVLVSNASAAAHITYSGNGKFTIASGEGELVTTGGTSVFCTGDTGTGKLGANPATSAELTVSFTGCESAGLPCTSTGGKSGLIDTTKLTATFGDIKTTEAGALLKPTTGEPFIVATKCGTVAFEAKGSVIGSFASTQNDKNTKALTLAFTETAGVQGVKKFEGESTENTIKANLGKGFETAGLKSSETLTLSEGSGQLLP